MGVVNIRLDVDYANELFYSNAPVPLKYYGIYEHVKKRAEELNFNLCSVGRVDKILELGHVI